MKIFLIGFMGSGKSTFGKKLSEALHIPLMDLDENIEKREALTVTEIFQKKGENYFRTVEAEALRKTKRYTDAVIATGGGAPCFHDNMKWMNENGTTIYLHSSAGELYHRLLSDRQNRPLLASVSDVELLEFIMGALGRREKFYSMADIKLSSKTASVSKAVSAMRKVKNKLKPVKRKK
jgi:shikimate kinase